MLALHTDRPVKMVYDREESFVGHVHRHPARIWSEHRATRAGRLVCVRDADPAGRRCVRIELDGCGLERLLVRRRPVPGRQRAHRGTVVYTNNPPCGAMRGFGAVQTCFAAEAQMDLLAEALEIDPVELRLLNALETGDVLPTGQVLTGLAADPRGDPSRRCDPRPGAGGASARPDPASRAARETRRAAKASGAASGSPSASRTSATRRVSTTPARRASCCARTAARGALRGSRGRPGRLGGDPPGRAARARHRRRDAAPARPRRRLGRLGLRVAYDLDGRRRRQSRAARRSRSGSGRGGGEVDVERVYRHPQTPPLDSGDGPGHRRARPCAFAVAAMRVVVEVDVELGLTRVVWIGTAQDVGHALNPQAVEGQIEGGTAQGLGLALMEEIQTRDGGS